eukprot:g47840.t1
MSTNQLLLVSIHSDKEGHQFDWDSVTILGQANQRHVRDFLEVLNRNSISKHVEMDPIYQPLGRRTGTEANHHIRLAPTNNKRDKSTMLHRSALMMLPTMVTKRLQTNLPIFRPETNQKIVFDVVMKNLVKEALEGQNCLVYTYGVTNSGKTYTIQGSRRDNGILPRSLAMIFNSIQGKLYPRMDLKPNLCNDVIKLDNKMVRQEELKKLSLLGAREDLQTPLKKNLSTEFTLRAAVSCDSDSGIGGMSPVSNVEESASRWADRDTVILRQEQNVHYSIWVSFFEIYNELTYDLLDTSPTANGKRQTLKLCEDKNGSSYVKDLTWINVMDAEEAWKILKIGRKNQSMASTHINQNSSRRNLNFSKLTEVSFSTLQIDFLIQAPSSKLFPSFRALLREHDGWNNCNAQAPLEEQEELDDDEDDGEDEMDISTLDKEVI